MYFEPPTLSRTIGSSSLRRLLSRRGEKLTWLEDDRLWVARAGEDPRSWCKPVDANGNGTGSWQYYRAPCDEYLRSAEIFESTRQLWLIEWRDQVYYHGQRREDAAETTIPIWNRGRPVFENMRKRRLWDDFHGGFGGFHYNDAPLSAALRTIGLQREQLDHVDRIICHSPELQPQLQRFILHPNAISNYYLIDQHYLLRRLVRLSWAQAWTSQFPADAIEFLENNNFSTRRWHILNLWMRVPEGRDFFAQNPQLAWLLASSWNVKINPVQRPLRSIRSLMLKPRSQILKWLDLPDDPGTFDLLKRIKPEILCPAVAYRLCNALRDRTSSLWMRDLCRGEFDGTVLYLLGKREQISYPILKAIHYDEPLGSQPVMRVYFQVRKMYKKLGQPERIKGLSSITSLKKLQQLHGEVATELEVTRNRAGKPVRRLRTAWAVAGRRIAPPLPSPPSFHPLATHEELVEEDCKMSNGLSAFSMDVARGQFYAYSIKYKEETATLGIRKDHTLGWRLADLRGPDNSRVSRELMQYVDTWLNDPEALDRLPQTSEEDWIDESEFYGMLPNLFLQEDAPF